MAVIILRLGFHVEMNHEDRIYKQVAYRKGRIATLSVTHRKIAVIIWEGYKKRLTCQLLRIFFLTKKGTTTS